MRAKRGTKSYNCSFCHNSCCILEGYNPKTKQCQGCDDYDKKEPARRKEAKELVERIKAMGHVDFQYTPGDPFW